MTTQTPKLTATSVTVPATPTNLDAAVNLGRAGYRVFPLPPRMKGAKLANWPNLATNDAAQIVTWWTAQSDANVAIVGGNGLLILDVDVRKGGDASLGALEAHYGALPPTLTARTPSGGRHLYFAGPDVANSSGKLGAGLDIKSRAGYVVAPPSVTIEVPGKQFAGRYEWADLTTAIAQAPQWLIDLAGQPKSSVSSTAPAFKLRAATPEQWADIKSALDHLATVSDVAGNQLWSDIGYSLLCLGDQGEQLWYEWSARAPGYSNGAPEHWWATHRDDGSRSDFRALFNIAQRYGWVNPRSRAAQPTVPPPPLNVFMGTPNEWSEPANFFAGRMEAPSFDGSELPPELATYPLLHARQTGFDPSMGINAALTIAAAAIPDYIQVCADSESNYFAQARLWHLTIAGPGAGKSPVQRELLKPLWDLHGELLREWQAIMDARDEDDLSEPPPQPRVIVADVTLEKLSDVLEENPRGILLATDEFSAWLGSLDQYKSGGVPGRDRGEWLRLFDGGPHQIERVSRGSKFIPNWGASILTASTPSQMQTFARNLPEDGLIQRFLVTLARRRQPRHDKPAPTEVHAARTAYTQLLRRLWNLRPDAHRGIVQLAPDARERFNAWNDENDVLTAAFSEVEPALAGHVAKYPAFALRIALTFHCARVATTTSAYDPGAYLLGLNDLELALTFLRRSAQHARAMYIDREGASNAITLARDIARYILVRSTEGVLQRRELTQHLTAFRKADEGLQLTSLRLVTDFGWIRPIEDATAYRKPHPTRFEINPAVTHKFSTLAEEERARRKLIVQRIAEHRA